MNIQSVAIVLLGLMDRISILIITISVIAFLFGLLKYVVSDSPEKKQKAKSFIINGVIILMVMISLWGFVALIHYTFSNELGVTNFSSNETRDTIDSLIR